jgi:hypothetical protein
LSAHSESLSRIRTILGSSRGTRGTVAVPYWDQLYVWQTPNMLLNVSVIMFIVGIVILVLDGLKNVAPSNRTVKAKESYQPSSFYPH